METIQVALKILPVNFRILSSLPFVFCCSLLVGFAELCLLADA